MIRFIQSEDVHWLKTPKGTIWTYTGIDSYIQPEDPSLINTAFGLNLDILDDMDSSLFQVI